MQIKAFQKILSTFLLFYLLNSNIIAAGNNDVLKEAELAFLSEKIKLISEQKDEKIDEIFRGTETTYVSPCVTNIEAVKKTIDNKKIILKPYKKGDIITRDAEDIFLIDPETGRKAIILAVSEIRIEKDLVILASYTYCGNGSYRLDEYTLKKIGEKWKIIKDELLAIS